MATLEEASAQIVKAEAQIAQQQEQVQSAQEKSAQQISQLAIAQQKLPKTQTQQALRQKMAGMMGQIRRKAIKKVKEKILGQREKIEEQQLGLETYKEQLTKYELEKIAPAKARIQQAQAEESAYKTALDLFYSKSPYAVFTVGESSPLVQKYYKEIAKAGVSPGMREHIILEQIEKFETAFPTEEILFDPQTLSIKGIKSGTLGETLPIKEYNKAIEKFKTEELAPPTVPPVIEPSSIEPTFLQRVGAAFGTQIPLVSALRSDDRGLKRFVPSKIDDSDRVTSVFTRKDDRMDIIPSVRDFISDRFIGKPKNYLQKGFQEETIGLTGSVVTVYDPEKEVTAFVPPEKTFLQKIGDIPSIGLVSAREFSGRQEALTGAEAFMGIGGVGGVGDKKVIDITGPHREEIKISKNLETQRNKNYKTWQNLNYYEIPKFESENRVNGQFDVNKLSDTKYKEYQRLINRTDKAGQTYQESETKYQSHVSDTSVSFGYLGGYERKVPVTELKTPFTYVKELGLLHFRATGSYAGSIYEDITEKTGRISKQPFRATGQLIRGEITGKEFISGFEETKPDVVYDLLTGEARVSTALDLKPSKDSLTFVQPEEVAKVATGIFTTGAYFTPVLGQALWGADIGEFGIGVGETLAAGEKLTREQKIEGAFLGGVLLTAGAIKGFKYFGKEARFGRDIAKLKKAKPEIFIGLEKGLGDTSTLLIKGRRQVGRVRAETLTKFDILRTGEKTFQVQKGLGGQRISKEMRFFRDFKPVKETRFTFFGEAEKVPGRIVKRKRGLDIIKEIKKPVTPIYSEVQILTKGKAPEFLKSFGIGLQRTKGKFTKVLSFKAEKGIRLKTGEVKIIDLPTGKVKEVKSIFGPPKVRVGAKDIEGFGIIKKIKPKVKVVKEKRIRSEKIKILEKQLSKVDNEILKVKTEGRKGLELKTGKEKFEKEIKELSLKRSNLKSKLALEKRLELEKIKKLKESKLELLDIPKEIQTEDLLTKISKIKPKHLPKQIEIKEIGEVIGLQIESKLLKSIKVKQFKATKIPSVSAYVGTGLYERTDSALGPLSLTIQPQKVMMRDVLQSPKVTQGVKVSQFEVTKQRDILILRPRTELGVLQKPTTRVLQTPKVKTGLAVSQVSRAVQVAKPIQRTITESTRLIQKPLTPKIKPKIKPKIFLPLAKPKKVKRPLKLPKKREEEFLGITKRYGKEVIVGVGRTAKEAEMIAKKDVLGKLSATVKVVTRKGRQIQLTPGKFFRQSRVDPLAVVQRKTLRLTALSERKEIAKARKRKPKKAKAKTKKVKKKAVRRKKK